MAENWIDQVPGATRTVKDRESGAPLILDDKGHAWREDPDHPGTPQDIGKWMPSLMDVMQNPEKELLLPNPIDSAILNYNSAGSIDYILILTNIEGFGKDEYAMPIYRREENGSVKLLEIRRE